MDTSNKKPTYLDAETEALFPRLCRERYGVTSAEDYVYNCIAHAADRNDAAWWPVDAEGVFWPIPEMEDTVECFILAFQTLGYIQCDCQEPEEGFEKVAIYVDPNGAPSHAAKQLPGNRWTSKLCKLEDITHHTLEDLEAGDDPSSGYGKVAVILKRPVPSLTVKAPEMTSVPEIPSDGSSSLPPLAPLRDPSQRPEGPAAPSEER